MTHMKLHTEKEDAERLGSGILSYGVADRETHTLQARPANRRDCVSVYPVAERE